jgi:hypothetical protein
VRRSSEKRPSLVVAAIAAQARLWLTLLTLTSFLAQGYLVQTHIHGLPQAFVADSGKQVASPAGTLPGDEDQATCVLCQEFVQAGNYLTPAAIAVLPPSAVALVIAVDAVPLVAAKPTSHSWRGRAPPHA